MKTLFILLLLGLTPFTAEACNCTWYAYTALKHVGVRIPTVPSLVETDEFKHPGAYSRSVMYVKDVDNCRVVLHEMVHHAQWLMRGDATDMHEWQRRENQAALITMLAESETGSCKGE